MLMGGQPVRAVQIGADAPPATDPAWEPLALDRSGVGVDAMPLHAAKSTTLAEMRNFKVFITPRSVGKKDALPRHPLVGPYAGEPSVPLFARSLRRDRDSIGVSNTL